MIPAKAALGTTEVREQVNRYWSRYRLVLVTNLREFELVGRHSSGDEIKLETYRLAATESEFERLLEKPRASAANFGRGLGSTFRAPCRIRRRWRIRREPDPRGDRASLSERDEVHRPVRRAGGSRSAARSRRADRERLL